MNVASCTSQSSLIVSSAIFQAQHRIDKEDYSDTIERDALAVAISLVKCLDQMRRKTLLITPLAEIKKNLLKLGANSIQIPLPQLQIIAKKVLIHKMEQGDMEGWSSGLVPCFAEVQQVSDEWKAHHLLVVHRDLNQTL